MAPLTTSAPRQVIRTAPAAPTQTSTWFEGCKEFLIRRRILLSALMIVGLVTEDVVNGYRPHDLLNWHDPLGIFGGLSVLIGLGLRSWAAGVLRKDAELTTTGPYRLIRNPLYLGSFLMMFGFCALINDPENYFVLLGLAIVLYSVKVRQEERLLSGLFPLEWAEYVRRTPRFVPRLAWVNLSANWRWSQWVRSREYQAFLATLGALAALKIWQINA